MSGTADKGLAGRLLRVLRAARAVRPTLAALDRRFGPGVVRRGAVRRVVVFPSLGLAFNRIKKNANTSTVILLRQIETGDVEERNAAKWNARWYFDLSPAERAGIGALHHFVIIRDPYARVLSAFLDKFRDPAYRRRHGDFTLTPDGFAQFVDWLERGGIRRDAHWDLQVKLMMLPLDRYDTVLKFEDFPACLRDFLAARGLSLPPDALAELYLSDRTKRTGAGDKLARFYTPEVAAKVARLYAADFAALGYPVQPGPAAAGPGG